MSPAPRTELATALFAVLAIMFYGIVLARVLHVRRHIVWNILFSAGAVALGWLAGLSFSALGLVWGNWLRTLVVVAGSVVIMLGAAVVGRFGRYLPVAGPMLDRSPWARAKTGDGRYAVWVRIPFSTVLMEEVLFRGVLLGLLLQVWSIPVAVVVSSLLFGLWHISPEAGKFEGVRFPALEQYGVREYAARVSTVAVTFLAAVLFGALRLWTGSLIAPWALHWALNAAGILAAMRVKKSES